MKCTPSISFCKALTGGFFNILNMKETFYFSHDYNARSDWKLVKVMMKHWVAGIWAYWCIIEMLYEEQWYLSIKEYDRISFELRVSYEMIQSVINDYWLFNKDDDNFWSNSVLDRLKQRMDKSEKARISVQKRWDKKKEENTNVLQTNYDSNTIKERKGKEIKGKESKTEIVVSQPNEYQIDMTYLRCFSIKSWIPDYAENYQDEWIKFCYYWSEKWKTWKIRAEWEKTFEIKRRFATWMSRKKETYQQKQKESALDITL